MLETKLHLSKNEDEQDVYQTQYKRLFGSLCYLCNTWMELAFNVGIVSRFMGRPKVSHLAVVKRILRYVKESIDCGILFPTTGMGRKCNLLDFTDSNWCKHKYDWKSKTGYIFMFGETSISWCSKKEPIVALSSCETEYTDDSLYVCQTVWLMNLLKELDNNRLLHSWLIMFTRLILLIIQLHMGGTSILRWSLITCGSLLVKKS